MSLRHEKCMSPQQQATEVNGQSGRETYREEREQHPGGNHDLTLPRIHLIWRTAAPDALPGSPFLQSDIQCKDTALGQVTTFQVKWDWACFLYLRTGTWRTLPQETHRLQREPAWLLQFKRTVWNHVRAFKGKWNRSRVYLFLHSSWWSDYILSDQLWFNKCYLLVEFKCKGITSPG